MKKIVCLLAAAMLSVSLFAKWYPSEKYAKFSSQVGFDKVFTFSNSGSSDNGSFESGVSTAACPGVLCFNIMSWDRYCGAGNEYYMHNVTVGLYDKTTNTGYKLCELKFSRSYNGKSWDSRYNNEGNLTWVSAFHGVQVYAVQKRMYRSHEDGSAFVYFNVILPDWLREWAINKGDKLEYSLDGNWDGDGFTRSTDFNASTSCIPAPSAPSVSGGAWYIEDGETRYKYTLSTSTTEQHQQHTEIYDIDNWTGDWENGTGSTQILSHKEQGDLTCEALNTDKFTYDVRIRKQYSVSTAYYSTKDMPGTMYTVSSGWAHIDPKKLRYPTNGLTISNNGDGKNKISWNTKAVTDDNVDECGWELQRSMDASFPEDATTTYRIAYEKNKTSYSQEDELKEREKGEVTYYYRLRRANAAWNYPSVKGQKTCNSNYTRIHDVQATASKGKAVVSWHIDEGVWSENMIYRLKYSGNSVDITRKDTKTKTIDIGTCNPTTITLQVIDGTTVIDEKTIENFIVHSTSQGIIDSYEASKGYYNSRVSIEWHVSDTAHNFHHYQLMRREMDSQSNTWVPLATVDHVNGTLSYRYEDNTCVPGVYYIYRINGYQVCSTESEVSSTLETVGFAQPYGVVTGAITYDGNQAVEGVCVSIEGQSTRSGRSLYFNANDSASITIPNQTVQAMLTDTAGSIMMWAKLLDVAQEQCLYDVNGLTVSVQSGKLYVVATLTKSTLTSIIQLDTCYQFEPTGFNHYAVTYGYDSSRHMSLNVYINGKFAKSWASVDDESLKKVTADSYLATQNKTKYASVYLDEISFWDRTLSASEIGKMFDGYLAGNEIGLTAYYRCDDDVPNNLYDISHKGTTYNGHHLEMHNVLHDVDNIPSTSQLALKTLTNSEGIYLLNNVPFSDEGSQYKITPTFGVHEFSPNVRPLFFNVNASTHNNIDFNDKSSFKVSGYVYYENTDYPVKGCNFTIDGTTCVSDGKMIESDDEGHFELSVPIGDHYITVKKDGHVFTNSGRYPATGTHTFTQPMTNLLFHDSTTLLLTGRVVGGEIEAEKAHGLGLSVNNIGQATIVLSAGDVYNFNTNEEQIRTFSVPDTVPCTSVTTTGKKGGAASKRITIVTDAKTGEFTAALPPVDFTVESVKIPTNDDVMIDASLLSTVKLGSSNIRQLTTDSVLIDSVQHQFTYSQALDITYRVEPTFTITDRNYTNGGFGEEEAYYFDEAADKTDTIIVMKEVAGKATYPYGTPFFNQNTTYTWSLHAYEQYVNKDNTPVDTFLVPLQRGIVTITNELGEKVVCEGDQKYNANDSVSVIGKDSMTIYYQRGEIMEINANQIRLDNNGKATYKFMAKQPNIIAPYTLGVSISYTNAKGTREYTWAGNNTFKGVVLGAITSGTNFVTEGPDRLLYILRDPPGSNSTASWEKGSTFSTTKNSTSALVRSGSELALHMFGSSVVTGTGVGFMTITDFSTRNNFGIGYAGSGSGTTAKTDVTSYITNDKVSTSTALVGADGDVFVGYSTNTLMGDAREVTFEKKADGTFYLTKKDAMYTSESFKTTFQYTQRYIEKTLIPNLKLLRNSLAWRIVTDAEYNEDYPNHSEEFVYLSKVEKDDPKFATEGNYIAIAPAEYIKSLPADAKECVTNKVCYYNGQISSWEAELEHNEHMKAIVVKSSGKFNQDQYNQAIETAKKALNKRTELRKNPGGDLDGIDTTRVETSDYYYGGWLIENRSFDGGNKYENKTTNTHSWGTHHKEYENHQFVTHTEFGFHISKLGWKNTAEFRIGREWTSDEGEDNSETTTVSYVLESHTDEALTVDIYQSPDGYGPIFSLRGGQTYCPYEGEYKTRYYEPGQHKLATATMTMEQPRIRVDQNMVTDIPAGKAGTYTLSLDNLAEAAVTHTFSLRLAEESNSNGAILSVDGRPLSYSGIELSLTPGNTLTKTLILEQSRMDVMKYDSIGVILSSACDKSLGDTVWLAARFEPSCSDVTLYIEQRVLNSQTGDTLPIQVRDLNVDFLNFKGIRVQYKGESDANWKLAQEFTKDEIKDGKVTFNFPMKSPVIPNQTYQFRAQTICDYGSGEVNNESETIEVVKDLDQPQPLGTPSPVGGVLTSEDEISVTFDKDIVSGKVIRSNIKVQGVLNDHTLEHSVALLLDGNPASTEAVYDLGQHSWSIEAWVYYTKGGNLFDIADGAAYISVQESGKLSVLIGNGFYLSEKTLVPNKWTYIQFTYDFNEETMKATINASMAYDDTQCTLIEDTEVESFFNKGPLSVGDGMKGAMQELTLWNVARSFATAQSEMHQAKYLTTPNLIGYWPLTEGYGVRGEDKARSRHMVIPANAWWYENENYAVNLAAGSHLEFNISELPITADNDYMVEMWYNTSKACNLWMVGDSVLGLSLGKNAVTLIANKKQYVTGVQSSILDGSWHHIALNVTRNGNATIYFDGVSVAQQAATNIPALAGSSLAIGSDFVGQIDEVRIWRATLSGSVINLYKHVRMRGNEDGLVAYYPFEKKQLNTDNGQYESVLTFEDHLTKNAAPEATHTSVEKATTSPALLEARPVEDVDFQYVCSDRKIVISIKESPARIEGCTLEFSVSDIQDAHGNYSDVTKWTAYVNCNRLIWVDNSYDITKEIDATSTLDMAIYNGGGSIESWQVTNCPNWLTLKQSSGTLAPLSSAVVSASVSSSVATGHYDAILYLTGNQGMVSMMPISLDVIEPAPDWSVRPCEGAMSINVIATVKTANAFLFDEDDIVAAFMDGECVGLANPQYINKYNAYYLLFTIMADTAPKNPQITFKVWDATSGRIYPNVTASQDVLFSDGKLYGTYKDPVVLTTVDQIEQIVTVGEGWNWISFNLQPNDSDVNTFFGSVADDLIMVKGKTDFAVPDNNGKLQGTLQTINIPSMYKVRMETETSIDVVGDIIPSYERSVTLKSGWNWLGYMPQVVLSVDNALADVDAVEGDMIKSKTQFALYDGTSWVGSLSRMAPGEGYLLKVASAQTFNYPSDVVTMHAPATMAPYAALVNHYTPIDEAKYSGNMTIVAEVKYGDEVVTDAEVAVYAGDECRATALAQSGLYYITTPGDDVVALTFRVWYNDQEYVISQSLNFVNDEMIGTLSAPYIIQLKNEPTSVNTVFDHNGKAHTVEKRIIHGHVVIIRDGEYYDSTGRHINCPEY